MVDPLRHPDLTRLGRQMREQFDETLEAEQHAAHTVARRKRTLRDMLLEAEDRQALVVISARDAQVYRGRVDAVGADHLVLDDEGLARAVVISAIVSVELRT